LQAIVGSRALSIFAAATSSVAALILSVFIRKRMFFAGEHTCFAYMGYMEGALQSGCKAAEAILTAAAHQGNSQRRSKTRSAKRKRLTSR
jgi:uncharacterized protein with NAD-binding domain and iron-sulfur cluster